MKLLSLRVLTFLSLTAPCLLHAFVTPSVTPFLAMKLAATSTPRPELPIEYEDDDAAFADDEDWITEDVPGKVVLNEIELAQQVSALSQLEEKWRKQRVVNEYEEARLLGWTGQAEMYNGRFAMFFLVVGLLTEYWTGVTIPGQIEEMLRVGGFIDVDF